MLRSVPPPNPPHPPKVVRDRHMLPAFPEIQVQSVRRNPAKLIALEFQLPLYAALLEPGVAEDDHVLVEHALEKETERSEQSRFPGNGRRRPIQSSLRLRVIHDGSFHKPNLGRPRSTPKPVSDEARNWNRQALAEVG